MSTEHVEDLLSAYLDNALTQEEHACVAAHLRTCSACNATLADFRRFDTLLAKQPRVSPTAALRARIFSSPEYLELVGDTSRQFTNGNLLANDIKNRQTGTQKSVHPDDASRPRLVAIPGRIQPSPLSKQDTKAHIRTPQGRNMYIQRFMQVMIAACLLLTLGVGSFIGWNLWQEQGKTAHNGDIIPPQGPREGGPLPAGMRFVFLHDNALWSGPEDGSTQAVRLTPTAVTVASYWVVRPASSGHTAGNLLAYVDAKQGYIHLIRSDGQSDTVIKRPLLHSVSVTSWNTPTGDTILHSLSWSPDGHTLAFIAATTATPTLCIYSVDTNQLRDITLPDNGITSTIIWSPNGVRIALKLIHNGVTSILDYNAVTHDVLTVATLPSDTVLTLDWAPVNDAPAITWSAGTQGHVQGIWLRHVGDADGADKVQPISTGEYTQAVYSRTGEHGLGSWLLSQTLTANTSTLLTLTLTGTLHTLVNGNHIGGVQWASDGTHATYFDAFASGKGTLHSIDATTGSDTVVGNDVRGIPAPVWSFDGQHLLYSIGTHSFVTDTQNGKRQLSVSGLPSAFTWSMASPHMVVIAIQNGTQGVYLVDTQHNTVKLLSTRSATGSIRWTQIP